jgi:hypothetical protein
MIKTTIFGLATVLAAFSMSWNEALAENDNNVVAAKGALKTLAVATKPPQNEAEVVALAKVRFLDLSLKTGTFLAFDHTHPATFQSLLLLNPTPELIGLLELVPRGEILRGTFTRAKNGAISFTVTGIGEKLYCGNTNIQGKTTAVLMNSRLYLLNGSFFLDNRFTAAVESLASYENSIRNFDARKIFVNCLKDPLYWWPILYKNHLHPNAAARLSLPDPLLREAKKLADETGTGQGSLYPVHKGRILAFVTKLGQPISKNCIDTMSRFLSGQIQAPTAASRLPEFKRIKELMETFKIWVAPIADNLRKPRC